MFYRVVAKLIVDDTTTTKCLIMRGFFECKWKKIHCKEGATLLDNMDRALGKENKTQGIKGLPTSH